ncbi:PAS domain S-box protein [Sesbania bispinosa]|nr:PAS domain S-box protein [Sesbania bispinosa]
MNVKRKVPVQELDLTSLTVPLLALCIIKNGLPSFVEVFHPKEFGLQFGFEPFKFTGRLFSITFIEATIQDGLRAREDEVRRVKLRNARLMKQLQETKQQLTVFQTVHSAEQLSSSKVERRRSV